MWVAVGNSHLGVERSVSIPMAEKKYTSPVTRPLDLGLPAHRLRTGVTLEKIAEETKISIRFLRAIEAEDFGQLPGGVYDRSYIRQYAAAVGFDATDLLACYRARMGSDAEECSKPRTEGKRSSKKRFALNWVRALGPTRFL